MVVAMAVAAAAVAEPAPTAIMAVEALARALVALRQPVAVRVGMEDSLLAQRPALPARRLVAAVAAAHLPVVNKAAAMARPARSF